MFFKYSGWLSEIIVSAVNFFGNKEIDLGINFMSILLPIGISFYTFQALSYIVDVYKSKIEPETHIGYYALYISFFPQLVAGPIERAGDLVPQFKAESKFTKSNFTEGAKTLLWGFFKKIVIADTLGLYCVKVFSDVFNPQWSGVDYLISMPIFAYYLYCDFSGYCDIAIGSARWFNIKLTNNFNKPFSSLNFRVFWSRWHITLSVWVKDYVYLPMGGRYGNSKVRSFINVIVSFIIVGVWHGASFNFLMFGLIAGLYVVIDFSTKDLRLTFFSRIGLIRIKWLYDFLCRFSTFIVFCSLSIFYCLKDINETSLFLQHLFDFSNKPNILIADFMIMLGLIVVLESANYITPEGGDYPFAGIKNDFIRISVYTMIIFAIVLLADRGSETFHYFQF
ncbi:MAG: MBOAT family O-acyltransferase [Flavobacteriales bacterium]